LADKGGIKVNTDGDKFEKSVPRFEISGVIFCSYGILIKEGKYPSTNLRFFGNHKRAELMRKIS